MRSALAEEMRKMISNFFKDYIFTPQNATLIVENIILGETPPKMFLPVWERLKRYVIPPRRFAQVFGGNLHLILWPAIYSYASYSPPRPIAHARCIKIY
jgi:hypothetical protein